MPRAYVLRGTNNGSFKKKTTPLRIPETLRNSGKTSLFVQRRRFRKKTTPPNLTIIDKYAKTLRKINVYEGVAGDDPGTSKTNLEP